MKIQLQNIVSLSALYSRLAAQGISSRDSARADFGSTPAARGIVDRWIERVDNGAR